MLNNPFRDGTLLWGYDVNDNGPSYPGRTLVARRHVPTTVLYENDLTNARGGRPILARYLTIDQTLHWADPANLRCMFKDMEEQRAAGCFDPAQVPIPVVVHLHGAEVPSAFDGAPESWFTPDGRQGAGYATLKPVGGNRALYRYPNGQEATTSGTTTTRWARPGSTSSAGSPAVPPPRQPRHGPRRQPHQPASRRPGARADHPGSGVRTPTGSSSSRTAIRKASTDRPPTRTSTRSGTRSSSAT